MSAPCRWGLLAVFLLAGCLPLFVTDKLEPVWGRFFPHYVNTLYFVFITCVIVFALTLLVDAVVFGTAGALHLAGYKIPFCPTRRFCTLMGFGVIGFGVLASAWALYAGLKVPELKTVEVVSDKIKSDKKIVFLSDLHIHRTINPQKIKAIVAATNAQNPDVVILGGDVLDDDVDRIQNVLDLLKDLKPKDGVFFVSGNHEFYVGHDKSVNALEKAGFTQIENKGVQTGTDLFVAGVPDVLSAKYREMPVVLKQAFSGAQQDAFRLLASHTPTDFGADNAAFDLELSGHTHGGQIFPFHIFAKLGNHFLSGLYRLNDGAQIYVSRGSGQWGPQMRFLAPSEITVLTLKASMSEKTAFDNVFGRGEVNPYSRFFTGKTYLKYLSENDTMFNAPIANVTFEPSARTHWHVHSGGQILLVTGGEGRYVEQGKAARVLKKGDVVRIPPDVMHWHGAAAKKWFAHISVETNVPDNRVTWKNPVTDDEYAQAR